MGWPLSTHQPLRVPCSGPPGPPRQRSLPARLPRMTRPPASVMHTPEGSSSNTASSRRSFSRTARCSRILSLRSWNTPTAPRMWPCASRMGAALPRMGTSLPSARRIKWSTGPSVSPRVSASREGNSSPAPAGRRGRRRGWRTARTRRRATGPSPAATWRRCPQDVARRGGRGQVRVRGPARQRAHAHHSLAGGGRRICQGSRPSRKKKSLHDHPGPPACFWRLAVSAANPSPRGQEHLAVAWRFVERSQARRVPAQPAAA